MAIVSISEAARLVGKSRTTLYRYIKDGKLSTCTDCNNTDGVDISELIRVFGELSVTPSEHSKMNNTEHHITHEYNNSEQFLLQKRLLKQEFEIENLKQKIEFLEILLEEKNSLVLEKEKRLLLLEHKDNVVTNNGTWISRLFNSNK